MDITGTSDIPLAVATKVIAQVQASHIDLFNLPAEPDLPMLSNDRHRYVLLDQIPDYATETFKKFRATHPRNHRNIDSESVVAAEVWLDFMAAA